MATEEEIEAAEQAWEAHEDTRRKMDEAFAKLSIEELKRARLKRNKRLRQLGLL